MAKPKSFLLMFFFTACAGTSYYTFLPIYLQSRGFDSIQIGILLAVGPFVAILAQPFWGTVGDRSKSKNSVFRMIMIGSSISALLYPISNSFIYLFIMISIFTFINNSMYAIQDAIALEGIEGTDWKFGHIRTAGTTGYAVMSVGAGLAAKTDIRLIFLLFTIFASASVFISFKIPVVIGHQSVTGKVSPWELTKNKILMLLMIFGFVNFLTQGYYMNFFSIHYNQLGADSFLLGVVTFVGVLSELPFLFFADRIVKKLGIYKLLISAAFIMGTRMVLLSIIKNVYALIAVNILHGGTFIIFVYCMAVFVNSEVQPELRATGQTVNFLIMQSLSRVVAGIAGGYLSSTFGIGRVFLYASTINYISAFLLIVILYYIRKNSKKPSMSG
jgi:PPP family 3-phenylpropionic acid transporter